MTRSSNKIRCMKPHDSLIFVKSPINLAAEGRQMFEEITQITKWRLLRFQKNECDSKVKILFGYFMDLILTAKKSIRSFFFPLNMARSFFSSSRRHKEASKNSLKTLRSFSADFFWRLVIWLTNWSISMIKSLLSIFEASL